MPGGTCRCGAPVGRRRGRRPFDNCDACDFRNKEAILGWVLALSPSPLAEFLARMCIDDGRVR